MIEKIKIQSGFLFKSLPLFLILFTVFMGPAFFASAQPEKSGKEVKTMPADEFIKSSAAQAYQDGKYEEAVAALDELLKIYPQDPLLLRYRAMALDQMGQSDKAIQIYRDLLLEYPDHIPTHYFLGQALARKGDSNGAAKEWQWVTQHGEDTPYKFWARQALGQTQETQTGTAPGILRWSVIGRYGYEYDSNVTLKPEDKSVANPGDQNAGRQVLDLAARYRAYSRRDLVLDLLYATRQTLHDDSLNEFNFHSEEFGLNLRKKFQMRTRDYVAGLRYEFLLGILDDRVFSARNRWNLSLETRYTPYTRTVFYNRIAQASFRDDGADRSRTSRDGLYNDTGVTHFWYTHDFRRYIFARQEFNVSATRGDNFDTVGTTSRLGFFTPLTGKLDLENSYGLEFRAYPNFSSTTVLDQSRRRDLEWDIYVALTYHLTPQLSVRSFYRYIGAENQNNIFDYDRQIGGVHLIYDLFF